MSTELTAPTFDPAKPYRLHPKVALRPEPFGALAYHYGNRKLNFMRSPLLVELVRELGSHASVDDALAASSIDAKRWPAFRQALAQLQAGDFLQPVDLDQPIDASQPVGPGRPGPDLSNDAQERAG